MTWRPWFPVGEAHSARARMALEPCLLGFGRNWFGRPDALRIETTRAHSKAPDNLAEQVTLYGRGLSVSVAPTALQAIALAALQYGGAMIEGPIVAEMLETLGRRQLSALLEALGRGLATPDSTSDATGTTLSVDGPQVVVAVSLLSRIRIHFAISAHLFPRAARRTCVRRAVTNRRDALDATQIHASAEVGRATLRISELHKLARGDVLLVDRKVHSPIEVVFGAAGNLRLTAYPCTIERRLGVQLVREHSHAGHHGS